MQLIANNVDMLLSIQNSKSVHSESLTMKIKIQLKK